MTQQHTPGPWEWRFEKVGSRPSAYHHESLLGPDNIPILTANDGLMLDSEYQIWHNDADKALIATAPDLLTAARFALSIIDAPDAPDSGASPIIVLGRQLLRAAIAKASPQAR